MNEERERFLTEVMGACWHDFDLDKPVMTYSLIGYVCTKCGNFILGNNDFASAEDFAKLWQWASDEPRLVEALTRHGKAYSDLETAEARNRVADELYRLLRR
jgi:hypothetical protein